MTYTLYTESHCVIDFLSQSYNECIATRERRKRASLNPQEAVRGARGEGEVGKEEEEEEEEGEEEEDEKEEEEEEKLEEEE